MGCKAPQERKTEQQQHRPHLVLDAELIPPLCGPSVHRTASSCVGTASKRLRLFCILGPRKMKCQALRTHTIGGIRGSFYRAKNKTFFALSQMRWRARYRHTDNPERNDSKGVYREGFGVRN